MAIEDSDPERRNLTVMSGAFIIYYLAGGSFDEKQITLEVVNMHFSRPSVLAGIAWIMLLWFVYRYWQMNKEKFSEKFPEELDKYNTRQYFEWYLNRTLPPSPLPTSQSGGRYYPRGIYWEEGNLRIIYSAAHGVSRNSKGKVVGMQGPTSDGKHICTDWLGWVLAIATTVECCVKEPSFVSYVMPYLLAALAFSLGIASFISQLL